MRKWIVLGTMVVGGGWPAPAGAAPICVQNQFGEVYQIEITGFGGTFFSLAGERTGPTSSLGGRRPFVGSAHLQGTRAHFTLFIGAATAPEVLEVRPQVLEGTLDGPAFTGGSAVERALVGAEETTILTLSLAACPSLP